MSEGMAGLIAVLIWTVLIGGAVVLNKVLSARRSTTTTNKTSKAWEQDAPYPECFEEEDDADL